VDGSKHPPSHTISGMKRICLVLFLAFACATASFAQTSHGPKHGTCIVIGGGAFGADVIAAFVTAAGGPDAPVVLIPTANDPEPTQKDVDDFKKRFGMTHVTLLHTRKKEEANSKAFVQPLKKARGVYIPGGRQWRLADSCLGTRTEKELRNVLKRGGVIAGSSAGATIQGSYLVRGAVEGNTAMMSPGHEQGFAYLKNTAVDQHIIARHREKDLAEVVHAHPKVLGIGIDEKTAIVVKGDHFQVIGPSKVAITDGKDHNGLSYYFLTAGDHFNLKKRSNE